MDDETEVPTWKAKILVTFDSGLPSISSVEEELTANDIDVLERRIKDAFKEGSSYFSFDTPGGWVCIPRSLLDKAVVHLKTSKIERK